MSTPAQIELATQFAPLIDADETLVRIMDDGAISEEKSRTSWAFVLQRLDETFSDEQLGAWPVPGSKQAVGNLPPDHWERDIMTADGKKTEKGTFYKSLFLTTKRGIALIAEINALDTKVADQRERKAEKSKLENRIGYHVKLLRRAMRVKHHLWAIDRCAPNVNVRFIKTGPANAKVISTAPKNIEVLQLSGGPDPEVHGKGDVLGFTSFLKLDPEKALAAKGGVPDLVTVLDLLATNTRGAEEEGEEKGDAVNYPAPKNMNEFESLVATFANFADKLGTVEGTKALWSKVNGPGSDDFIKSLEKVYGMAVSVVTNPAIKRRLEAIDQGPVQQAS